MTARRPLRVASRDMCGRFTQRMTWRELHERMGLIGTPLNLRPRYNVAPSQDVAARARQ